MGSNRAKKRKRRNRRRKERRRRLLAQMPRLRISIVELDIARGHDGFLRGKPEPVTLLAAWSLRPGGPFLCLRELIRYARPSSFPERVAPLKSSRAVSQPLGSADEALLFLCVALEEDSGRDIQRLYASLAEGDLLLWSHDQTSMPAPIAETAAALPALEETRVSVQTSLGELSDWVRDDKYVDASALLLQLPFERRSMSARLLSSCERNDWTLQYGLRAS